MKETHARLTRHSCSPFTSKCQPGGHCVYAETHISGGCCALLMSAICTTSRNAPSTFTASFALVSM